MDLTTNYLQVLSESLDKKLTILAELNKLTIEQKDLSEAETFDDEVFNKTVHQKAALIEQLEQLDDGFQTLYDRVKEELERNREAHKDEIVTLKAKIGRIMDESASLQVMEQRNKVQIAKRFSELKQEIRKVKKSRQTAANYYKTMNKISEEPYFMDKKK